MILRAWSVLLMVAVSLMLVANNAQAAAKPVKHHLSPYKQRHSAPIRLKQAGISSRFFHNTTPALPTDWYSVSFPKSEITWNNGVQGAFVEAIVADHNACIWVGTEDCGIWKFNPRSIGPSRWAQFSSQNGLQDDSCYALACDKMNRIWEGSLNHGVSVYCGTKWVNYDSANGPLGQHVFAIACDQSTGDVWIATEAGLTRYSEALRSWFNYTKADGLPCDQATSLLVCSDSSVVVGTECAGIAIGSPKDAFQRWRTPPYSGSLPSAPTGSGLPCGEINCLLETKNHKVLVGTDDGVAISTDHFETWSFIRGRDWLAKLTGLSNPTAIPALSKPPALLSEDYVTALSEDINKQVWVGHRQTSCDTFTSAVREFTPLKLKMPSCFVKTILPLSNGSSLVGTYGGGITAITPVGQGSNSKLILNAGRHISPGSPPAFARTPTHSEISSLRSQIRQKQAPSLASCAYIGEDWVTQGDWEGRYGRQYANLCAADSPFDEIFNCNSSYDALGGTGPHITKGDLLRHWITLLTADTPKALYNPTVGHRRLSDWDDHGETYSQDHEGPDIWIDIKIPDGLHRISLYFLNKDGHDDENVCRDYIVDLLPGKYEDRMQTDGSTACTTRVHDFYGGVYKRFIAKGPGYYHFYLHKNSSFNTVLTGIFIDQLAPDNSDAMQNRLSFILGPVYSIPLADAVPPADPDLLDKLLIDDGTVKALHNVDLPTISEATQLWSEIEGQLLRSGVTENLHRYQIIAYRAALGAGGSEQLLANMRWHLDLWNVSDRSRFESSMQEGFDGLTYHSPLYADNLSSY